MVITAILLAVIIVMSAMSAIQVYLTSNLTRRLTHLAQRLERLEQLFGGDVSDENRLQWTPRGTVRSPSGVTLGSLPPPLDLFTASGTYVTLSSLMGTPALLLFLSPRCSVCTALFSNILDYLDAASLPFAIPSTIVTLSERVLQSEVDEAGTEGIRILQTLADDKVYQRYGVSGTPCAVFLDEQGIVCDASYIATIEELFAAGQRASQANMRKEEAALPAHLEGRDMTEKANGSVTRTVQRKLRSLLTWVLMVSMLLAISLFVAPVRIQGQSMEPTLLNSTWALVSPIAAALHMETRDTIVTLRYPYLESLYLVKRVIATPEDCIAIRDDTVYINNHPQEEPFVQYHAHYTKPQQCLAKDELYVLGDHRSASFDSASWGPLPLRDVTGILLVAFHS